MKAQTLAVCLPGSTCDKKCPYCVSKMTWAPPADEAAWNANLHKVAHFARMAQVTDVIITGKGEPTINSNLLVAAKVFSDWPLVVQTNGRRWSKHLDALITHGSFFNVIAVSIDSPIQMHTYSQMWEEIKTMTPTTSRITVMLTPEVCQMDFSWWEETCKTFGIRGLSFREITIPGEVAGTSESNEVTAWIEGLAQNPTILDWKKSFDDIFSNPNFPVIRRLPYGAVIKDFSGVSVTKIEFCMQDSNSEDDIRSLVYNQDGHLYTTWSSPASMIF